MSITFPVETPSEGDTFVHERETYTYHHGKWAKQYTYSSGGGGAVDSITSNTSAITVDSNDPTNPLLDITWGSGNDEVPRGNHLHSYAATGHLHSQYATPEYVDDQISAIPDGSLISVENNNPSNTQVGDLWFNKSSNTLNIRIS